MTTPWREHMLDQMRTMEALLPRAEAELSRYANVEAVTVGAKERNGYATPELAFQVYVRVKKHADDLGPDERIPANILGFPTDVILIEASTPTDDDATYRPLCGGTQIEQSGGAGTLGIIAVAAAGSRAPVGEPVILTNSHVAPTIDGLVGQPSAPSDCFCCACCDVGQVVDSQITGTVDAAIATLNDDMRYSHEILEVGTVRGWVAATTLVAGDPVKKRGRTSGLTHGLFSTASAIDNRGGTIFTNQVRVTSLPGGPPFQLGGDSGAVLLDAQDRVVGLMHSAVLPAGTPAHANRIENVIALVKIDIPVMGTAGAVPLATGGYPRHATNDRHAAFAALGRHVVSTEAGRAWWALLERHRDEVRDMIRGNRHVKVAWQRYQGQAFVAHYMKTVVEPGYSAPASIGGMSPENLLIGMAALLQQHGSPSLAADVRVHYLDIILAARDCRRAEDFLNRLGVLDVPAPVG